MNIILYYNKSLNEYVFLSENELALKIDDTYTKNICPSGATVLIIIADQHKFQIYMNIYQSLIFADKTTVFTNS